MQTDPPPDTPARAVTHRQHDWAHGRLTVQDLGAMLGPVIFRLPDGREVSPLHVAPWAEDPQAASLPGILRALRGDFAIRQHDHLIGNVKGFLKVVRHDDAGNTQRIVECPNKPCCRAK